MASDLAQRVKASSGECLALTKVLGRTENVKAELSETKAKLTTARLGLADNEQGSSILSKRSEGRTESKPGFLKKLFRHSSTKPSPGNVSQWADKAEKQTKTDKTTVDELVKKRDVLQAQLKERTEAEQALLGIYATLFGGPMPQHPGKDECDAKVRGAEKMLKASQDDVSNMAAVSNALYTAQMRIRGSIKWTNTALHYAPTAATTEELEDMSSSAIFQVTSNLFHAHKQGLEATEFLSKAKTLDPEMPDYDRPLLIDTSPYRSQSTSAGTGFGDILRDMAKTTKVPAEVVDPKNLKASRASLEALNEYVDRELARVEERIPKLAEARNEKQEALDTAQEEWLEFCRKLWDQLYASS